MKDQQPGEGFRSGVAARQRGMTAVEISLALIILAVAAAIMVPAYQTYREGSLISAAIADIRLIGAAIDNYKIRTGDFPENLGDVGYGTRRDPYGNIYEYVPLTGTYADKKAKARKDKNLHPLNTDYDLYSRGFDGKTNIPLTAGASHDDILRANDGEFVGLATNY